ncbi:EsaB/YukD family protein [Bacillus weihaiensis]|uniref:Ubiquitin n=1 Tax=Bacillus weihaiensis TaxID=1547283 RepID=A0A1L3MX19_9BACI|nr:EsaB/YukD family protein [Bacillus weihaiensis]APH06872.1 ubiquitin [Bacillus weihaiensis]
MYIEVTIDLKHYHGDTFDLRLSNYHSVKEMVSIVWQAKNLSSSPREGYWIRVTNKQKVVQGNERLIDARIFTGDRIEIL